MSGTNEAVRIPEKLYFKIGEVSKIVGVKPYVLRYWETEFKEIEPAKSRSNQRLYRRKDVDALLTIKNLLYKEGFTITGARKKIRDHLKSVGKKHDTSSSKKPKQESMRKPEQLEQIPLAFENEQSRQIFLKLKQELEELQSLLRT